MTDVLKFADISGNIIDLSSSENYRQHAFAEHSCTIAIVNQFDNDFYHFLRDQEELNIIDLGANVGLFSLYASPIAEKIFAVEPTQSHFELLNELVGLTQNQNIEIHQVAIGLEDGESNFYIHERNSTMNSFVQHKTDPHSGKIVKVKTLTLNSFIDSLKLDSKVGFVKMDIEGFENQVVFEPSFEDAILKVDAIYVEVHDYEDCGKMDYNFNKIKDRFKSWGRTVEKLQFDSMLVY